MRTFCPNCEKETESTLVCEVYECGECNEDNGNYEKPLITKLQNKIEQMQKVLDALTEQKDTLISCLSDYADSKNWSQESTYGEYGEESYWVWEGTQRDPTYLPRVIIEKLVS